MKKALVVDDSSTARMFIRRCIEISAQGRQVDFIEAANGSEALELLEEHKPEIIFSDYTMPNMTGGELLQKIKSLPSNSDSSVVIISSAGNPALEKKLMEAGASAVLKKPISPSSVMPYVTKFLEDENE
jgi:two-component system chemotaxis response regulator CheY